MDWRGMAGKGSVRFAMVWGPINGRANFWRKMDINQDSGKIRKVLKNIQKHLAREIEKEKLNNDEYFNIYLSICSNLLGRTFWSTKREYHEKIVKQLLDRSYEVVKSMEAAEESNEK